MAVSAKRFNFLDEETNVATLDFFNPGSSDIFNSVNNELKDITSSVEDFISKATQDASIPTPDASIVDETVRTVKDLAGSLKDSLNISSKDIDKLISSLLPDNPLAQSAFNKLSTSCKNNALNNGGLGKPYDPSLNCNGNNRTASTGACSTGEFGNVLSKLTNGQYNSQYTDLNAKLTSLMGLANYGYNMNMCGVFGALAGGLDKDMLSRASGGLLDNLSSKGNMLGIFDLAASSAGLHPLLENPNGISSIFNNFNIPSDVNDNGYSNLSDLLTTSVDSLDSGWNISSYDNTLSTGLIDNVNDELKDVYKSSLMDNFFDEDNLDLAVNNNTDYLSAAIQSKNNSSTFFTDLNTSLDFI